MRIAILKVLAERYRKSNPGSRVQVVGYEARPLLRITPPQDASDRRGKVYNFIDAIRNLPVNFTKDEKSLIMSRVNPRLYGKLRSLFVVISDDLEKVNKASRPQQQAQGSSSGQSQSSDGASADKRSRSTKRVGSPGPRTSKAPRK